MILKKFIPFAKVNASKHEVSGVVTAEIPDKDGEICDYEGAKAAYKTWNAEFEKATDGKSIGNLRYMHQLQPCGKVIGIDFKDDEKEIEITCKVTDDKTWNEIEEGVLTGFSQGGNYAPGSKVKVGNFVKYTPVIGEVSVVDNPCLSVAHFAYIKADGAFGGMRKLKTVSVEEMVDPNAEKFEKLNTQIEELAKKIPAVAAPAAAPATPAPTAAAEPVKKTLAETLIEEGKKAKKSVSQVATEVYNAHKYLAADQLKKSMYDVQDMASVLMTISRVINYLRYEKAAEGDDSAVPDNLHAVLENLMGVYMALVDEETKELLASCTEVKKLAKANSSGGNAMLTAEQVEKLEKATKSVVQHLGKAKEMVQSHNDSMQAHIDKCMKAISGGTEEAEIVPGAATAKTFDPAELVKSIVEQTSKLMDEKIEKANVSLVGAIFGVTEEDLAKHAAGKTTEGIGDRTQVVLSKTAPVQTVPAVQTHAVEKVADSADPTATPTVQLSEADIKKAQNGDQTDFFAKLAKGIKANPGGVPQHLHEAMSAIRN